MLVKSRLGAHCSSHGYPGLSLRSSYISKLEESRGAVCAMAYVVIVALRVPHAHVLGKVSLIASYRDADVDVRPGTSCPHWVRQRTDASLRWAHRVICRVP